MVACVLRVVLMASLVASVTGLAPNTVRLIHAPRVMDSALMAARPGSMDHFVNKVIQRKSLYVSD